MGYYIQQRDTDFTIKAENCAAALAAVKALPGDYSWVDGAEVARADTLLKAVEAWNWDLIQDDDGSIGGVQFEASKAGDEEVLFGALAPFVEDGSYIEMQGEEGEIWRYTFRGGVLHEEVGQVTFTTPLWEDDRAQFARMLAGVRGTQSETVGGGANSLSPCWRDRTVRSDPFFIGIRLPHLT
jgi:hypothetical protein